MVQGRRTTERFGTEGGRVMGSAQGSGAGSGTVLPRYFCWLFVSCFPSPAWGCQGCTERSKCSPGHWAFVVVLVVVRSGSLPTCQGRSFPPDPENPSGQDCRPGNPRPGFDHQAARRSTRRQAVPTLCFVRLIFFVDHSA